MITDPGLCPTLVVDPAYFRVDDIVAGQKMTVDLADGTATPYRVAGIVAPRGVCIWDGQPGCWTVDDLEADDPDLSIVHQGNVFVDSGGQRLACAVLASNLGHAPIGLGLNQAKSWMDHTGTQIARIRYAYSPLGLVASGVLWPEAAADERLLAELEASPTSLDARWMVNVAPELDPSGALRRYRLAGAVLVNTPGLPIARAASGPIWIFDGPTRGAATERPLPKGTIMTKTAAIATADTYTDTAGEVWVRRAAVTELLDVHLEALAESPALDDEHAQNMDVRATAFADTKAEVLGDAKPITASGCNCAKTAASAAADLGMTDAAPALTQDATSTDPQAEIDALRMQLDEVTAERDALRMQLDEMEMAQLDQLVAG